MCLGRCNQAMGLQGVSFDDSCHHCAHRMAGSSSRVWAGVCVSEAAMGGELDSSREKQDQGTDVDSFAQDVKPNHACMAQVLSTRPCPGTRMRLSDLTVPSDDCVPTDDARLSDNRERSTSTCLCTAMVRLHAPRLRLKCVHFNTPTWANRLRRTCFAPCRSELCPLRM